MNLLRYYEDGGFLSEKIEFWLDVARFSTVWSRTISFGAVTHSNIQGKHQRSKLSENPFLAEHLLAPYNGPP